MEITFIVMTTIPDSSQCWVLPPSHGSCEVKRSGPVHALSQGGCSTTLALLASSYYLAAEGYIKYKTSLAQSP